MNIEIKNLRFNKPQCAWQVRVDRTSVLGNPFYMNNENERNQVCDKYEMYFNNKILDKNSSFYKELERLINIYNKYGKLELFCWCYPKRCHAETIKKYIKLKGGKNNG